VRIFPVVAAKKAEHSIKTMCPRARPTSHRQRPKPPDNARSTEPG